MGLRLALNTSLCWLLGGGEGDIDEDEDEYGQPVAPTNGKGPDPRSHNCPYLDTINRLVRLQRGSFLHNVMPGRLRVLGPRVRLPVGRWNRTLELELQVFRWSPRVSP